MKPAEMDKKKSLGRQKIEIKKITTEANRQVTFSKRRSGLFKKASELCILCGAEVVIIVFSKAGKPFSFGHPRVDSVVDRFLHRSNSNTDLNTLSLAEVHHVSNIDELNRQYIELLNQIEAEKNRSEMLKHFHNLNEGQMWWEASIDELNLHELEQLLLSMEELKKNVAKRADELMIRAASPSFLSMNPLLMMDPCISKMNETNTSVLTHPFNFGFDRRFY